MTIDPRLKTIVDALRTKTITVVVDPAGSFVHAEHVAAVIVFSSTGAEVHFVGGTKTVIDFEHGMWEVIT